VAQLGIVRLLALVAIMNLIRLFIGFWKWLGLFQGREAAIERANSRLLEQHNRAEVFALTEEHKTSEAKLEVERDNFKTMTEHQKGQIFYIHKELDEYSKRDKTWSRIVESRDEDIRKLKAEIAELKQKMPKK